MLPISHPIFFFNHFFFFWLSFSCLMPACGAGGNCNLFNLCSFWKHVRPDGERERTERATEGRASSSLNMNRQFYVKPRLCGLVKLSALIKRLAVTNDSSAASSGPALWTAPPPAALTSTRGSLLWLAAPVQLGRLLLFPV